MARRVLAPGGVTKPGTGSRIAGSDGIVRSLRIIEKLAPEATGLTVTQLSEVLTDPKPLVHRALAVLVDTGFAFQNPQNSQYSLTTRVLEIANQYHLALGFQQPAQSLIQAVADRAAATVEVCRVIAGASRGVHIAMPSSTPTGLMVMSDVGEIQSPYATAAGKLWLAEQSAEVVEEYLERVDLVPLGTNTITDPADLRTELDLIRSQGHAYNRMEDNTGYVAVAVPMRRADGGFLGSVSLVRPQAEVDDVALAEMLHHAREASRSLEPLLPGWSPTHR